MEELLFIHDPDGKYEGANFLICSNDEIIQQRLQVCVDSRKIFESLVNPLLIHL